MNTSMTVHEWSDLVHLVQEREALWKQARARGAAGEDDNPDEKDRSMPHDEDAQSYAIM